MQTALPLPTCMHWACHIAHKFNFLSLSTCMCQARHQKATNANKTTSSSHNLHTLNLHLKIHLHVLSTPPLECIALEPPFATAVVDKNYTPPRLFGKQSTHNTVPKTNCACNQNSLACTGLTTSHTNSFFCRFPLACTKHAVQKATRQTQQQVIATTCTCFQFALEKPLACALHATPKHTVLCSWQLQILFCNIVHKKICIFFAKTI